MAKILFCNIDAPGHVNHTLAIVRELVALGEQVTYAAPFWVEKTIRATGASFAGYSGTPEWFVVGQSGRSNPWVSFVDEALKTLPELLSHAKRVEPDVVVFDPFCLAGRLVAEILGVPAIRAYTTYAANEHFSLPVKVDPSSLEAARVRAQELAERFHVNTPKLPAFYIEPAALALVFLPRAFQPAGDTFDERFVFVGPSIEETPAIDDFPLEELERAGSRVLLISLGTLYNNWPQFFDMCFEAFGGTSWTVVLSVGDKVDPAVIARAPPNFIARTTVPQLDVLKRARAFVTHGGMNSAMEALFFGVPMVVVPQIPEQAVTAKRVAELGLGIALSREGITSKALASTVERVSSEASFGEAVARMQAEARDAGGYRRAAAAIMELARRGC